MSSFLLTFLAGEWQRLNAPLPLFLFLFFLQGDHTHTCTNTLATHREEETDTGRCEAVVAAGTFFPIKAFSSPSSSKQRGFFGALFIAGSSSWHPDQSRRRRQKKDNAHWQDTPTTTTTSQTDTSRKVNRVERKGTGTDERGRHRHWRLGACRCLPPCTKDQVVDQTAAGYNCDHKRLQPFLKSCDFCLTGRCSP